MTETPKLISNLAERNYCDVLRPLVLLADMQSMGRKPRPDRTGVGTFSLPCVSFSYPANPLPILSKKKIFVKSAADEMCWYTRGETNIKVLKSKIWNEWADENGNLGPVYGHQYRNFNGVDQLKDVIDRIRKFPWDRKLIVSFWNAADRDKMALTPCHVMHQFRMRECGTTLDLILTQPSGDIFLGVPFNMLNYSLTLHIVCWATGYEPGTIHHTIGDCHLYANHVDVARKYLEAPEFHCSPKLIKPEEPRLQEMIDNYFIDIQSEDLVIEGYRHGKYIPAKIAV